ncbi:sensor histidine kinase [Streptomyces sp. NPDC089799]|uniref:sensor histidine kinase n=1 Tax=Streptomyces sp. NPDC089799 TaxID=3155066 RepID=UPI00342EB90E
MSGTRATARHTPSRHAATGSGRQIRPQLLRAAVLPTLAAGLSGAAAVIFTLQLGGGSGHRDARLWPVLAGCGLLVAGALAAALLGAQRAARTVRDRCEVLRRSSTRGRQELRTTAERLERGEAPARPVRTGAAQAATTGKAPAGADEFWLLAQELRGARDHAQAVLLRLAGPENRTDSEQKVEVFVNLARRLQSLVHREISLLDGLEDTVEDPDLLKELFHVDHLATRIRRHAENLAVLGGAASRRQWTRPIDLSEVLRSAVAEVEQYTRVKVVPPAGGTVRGHAVADVVHLLAELVENATVFSAPDTDVVLRAERVTSGIAVEVEDRGLGMPPEEQHRMNELLGDPDQISVRHLLADGRIGLFVVSSLARRHGIAVELKSNIYGGVLAVLVLPRELLGAESADTAADGSRLTRDPLPPLEPVRLSGPRPAGIPRDHTRATPPPAPPMASPEPMAPAAPVAPAAPAMPVAPGVSVAPAVPVARADVVTPPEPVAPVAATGTRAPAVPAAVPAPRPTHERLPEDRPGDPASGSPSRTAIDPLTDALTDALTHDTPVTIRSTTGGCPGDARSAGRSPTARSANAAPAAAWSADTWPADAPSDSPRSAHGRSAAARSADAWPADVRAADDRPAGGRGLGVRTGGGQYEDGRTAGERAAETPQPEAPRAEAPAAEGRSPGDPPNPVAAASASTEERGTEGGPGPGQVAGPPDGGRPPLPRRRAQAHLAPQLRDAPPPRAAYAAPSAEVPVHDPNLMAAFRRGFGRAQSENP